MNRKRIFSVLIKDKGVGGYCGYIVSSMVFFRAAFKFTRRVHFALRLKMLKSTTARHPVILLDFINRPSGETAGN